MQTAASKGTRLSLQQARLWSLQEDLGNRRFVTWGTILLEGQLSKVALRQAWQTIYQQQEILRTVFYTLPGMNMPVQAVTDPGELRYPEIDLTSLSTVEQEEQQAQLTRDVARQPCNLEHAPVWHLSLLSLTPERHFLLLCLPSLCADFPTLSLLLSDLQQHYIKATDEATENTDDEDPLQYNEVSAWQSELLTDEDGEDARSYWRSFDLSSLSAMRFASPGPAAPIPATENNQGNPLQTYEFKLPNASLSALETLCEREDLTLSAVLVTSWELTLRRLLGLSDFLLGILCDGRPYEELTGTSGPYVRMIPVRAETEKDRQALQLLHRVNTTLSKANEDHLYFSWETDRSHRAAFFPASFACFSWPSPLHGAGIRFSLAEGESIAEYNHLQLSAFPGNDTLRLKLEYDSSVVERDWARRSSSIFCALLNDLLSRPEAMTSTLSLINAEEQQHLLRLGTGTPLSYPNIPLHRLFEEQVQQRPEQLALIYENERLSYQELNARASRLAGWLQGMGVGPGEQVALYLDRSASMIVALLAVLKAGGAYVPLDPANPPARLTYQLAEIHPKAILTQEHLREHLPSEIPVFCAEQWDNQLVDLPAGNLPGDDVMQSLAYIMYTSGSTGTPKGVMIEHQSITNYIHALNERLQIHPGWSFGTVSTLAADLGNTAVFCSLALGGTLHVFSYATVTDGIQFARATRETPLDVLKIVPSHLEALLASGSAGIFPRKMLILGGEALSWELVQHIQDSDATCEIVNHYGPTEATIGVFVNRHIEAQHTHESGETVTLGRPLANIEACVLDEGRLLVPEGIVGELYLGGPGLARGYLHQEALTQEHFVQHPQKPGMLLYKTGDLVRWTPKEELAFLGRVDRQVKIRGYRVEPGELEAALRRHPAIQQCVVAVREELPGEKRLVAYVVLHPNHEATTSDLQAFLNQQLPTYMMLETLIPLQALPLTPNGKIDYQALTALVPDTGENFAASSAPRGAIEEILLNIWEEMLPGRKTGIHDNFFKLGGHSLMATRVVARACKIFNINLPILSLFENPTIAGLAEHIQSLLRAGQTASLPPLTRIDRDTDLPLSFAQQRLWFLDQLEPGSSAYTIPMAAHIEGDLNIEALRESLSTIIQRHESLRTTFSTRANQSTVQIIGPANPFPLPYIDLSNLDRDTCLQEAQHLAEQEGNMPFDLQHGPLLRTTLLILQARSFVILFSMHHIVSDAWSRGVLIRELAALYAALTTGKGPELPPLPFQYADYASWQRQWLQGAIVEEQVHYWKGKLANLTPLEFPTDYVRPTVQSYRGAQHSFLLPQALLEQLKVISRREGVTLYMTLLAAFQLLLARFSRQDDVVVGSPIANRNQQETENLIGFFVNMLALRTSTAGNPSFTTLLQRVRETCLEAYAHQDIPFEQLVEALQPRRELSRSPLFQVVFTMQNASEEQPTLGNLKLEPFPLDHTTSKFDLELALSETDQGLLAWVEYSTDLFQAKTIHRILLSWQTLLVEIVKHPEQRLSELPLMTEEMYLQVLSTWNITETPTDERRTHTLLELFTAQVARTPDAIAVASSHTQVSYAELERRSTQLAWYLREMGIEHETLIGLYMERSIEMLITLLAIFKAGGAYIPLDPTSPPERLMTILSQAKVSLFLTQASLLKRIPPGVKPPLCLDATWQAYEHYPRQLPYITLHPQQLAYVIFTSGSTGRPKGAMVTQKGMLNHLLTKMDDLQMSEGDHLAQTASASFDISVWQFLAPLLVGGRTQIIPDDIARDPRRLLPHLGREQVTLLEIVPSLLRAMLNEEEGISPSHPMAEPTLSLRWLIVTGEAFPAELGARWLRRYASIPLINAYGPTECSDDVTHEFIRSIEPTSRGILPIGKALANTRLYVLDSYLAPSPLGIPGELYVGGLGVGRGYMEDAGQTAESFIPDCFGNEPGGRLYRTGDLVRYLDDGRIEYLGRVDYQVKVRGYRIELSEIEAHLQRHPDVRENVVIVREDTEGDPLLTAYVVTSTKEQPTPITLSTWLEKTLPTYMLPAQFMFLDALPLTANGKIDRQALPEPAGSDYFPPSTTDAPEGTVEELLANIWEQVLNQPIVNRHTQFFALGGHSLLVTSVMARVQEIFGIDLPLRTLFEAPTLAGLAEHVENALQAGRRSTIPALTPVPHEAEFPLSFSQRRLWFLDQLDPGTASFNIPMLVRVTGPLDIKALQQAIRELVHRHESLRTVFVLHDGLPAQTIQPVEAIELQIIPLQTDDAAIYQQAAKRPFDLTHGPLMRAQLFVLPNQEYVLLLVLHHIISDGWSGDVLIEDLTAFYRSTVTGSPSALPELPVQYRDFIYWQNQWLQGQALQEQLDFWEQQLAGLEPLELPLDHPRPPVQGSQGARYRFMFPPELLTQLRAFSQREGVTLFMTLLATFQVLLARYSGQTDIAVGTLVANRRHPAIERLIGFFLNTLVLRTDLSGNPIVSEVLKRVREVALKAYSHQDVPFEQVLDALQPERDLSRSPLFQVMLQLRTIEESMLTLPGLQLEPLTINSDEAKFDLFFDLLETSEGLQGQIEYRTELFEQATIERIKAHFLQLLSAMIAHPDQRILALSLLTIQEQQAFDNWNATQTALPEPPFLPFQLEAQARRTPDSLAASFGDECLSYATLDRQASLLASQLLTYGIGPEVIVGVCVPRQLELLIALLAILKAGGAYLPLDPTLPAQRLHWMLEDTACPLVLTLSTQRHLLPSGQALLCLDTLDLFADTFEVRSLPGLPPADQLAYVLYTSGSTGRPKGAMLTHRGLLNHLLAKVSTLTLGPTDRLAQTAPLSFDIALWQLLAPLLVGAHVQLLPDALLPDPPALLAFLAREASTLLETVPSLLLALLDTLEDDASEHLPPPDLRWLVLTGEALSPGLARRWLRLPQAAPLVNAYGPTECSDDVAQDVVHPPFFSEMGSLPIGHALANTHLYVLDPAGGLLPVGVSGELYIGGQGVGRGYLQDPARTAAAFVPDPFSGEPGARLYRTGDRVLREVDGRIHYLGRLDRQIKVRGQRIELGEIEAALQTLPEVTASTVEVRDGELVAYLVAPSARTLTLEMVRTHLRSRLTEAMLPSGLVQLEALPVTAAGKLDRQALPAPTWEQRSGGALQTGHQTPTEELLGGIWQEVLGITRIGREDNFFELGGHSLLATRVQARLRSTFAVDLPLRALFEAPTLRQLAHRLDLARRQQSGPARPELPFGAGERPARLPLSFAQQRLWFLDQLEPGQATYHVPLALLLEGPLDPAALEASLHGLVARHESLRTRFVLSSQQGSEPEQVIDPIPQRVLVQVDLRTLPPHTRQEEAQRLARQEARAPFDLAGGPLLRATLLRLAQGQQVLLLTQHHSITDGWSGELLGRELFLRYRAASRGEPFALPAPRVQYADYALWQRAWIQGAVLEEQRSYWQKHLAGIEPLALPTDHPRPAVQRFEGGRVPFQLPAAVSEQAQALSRREGVTLFMTLLASFQVVLMRWSGQEDIAVGSPIAGRTRSELEEVLGCFVNTLVLRTDLSGRPSFVEVLRRVREGCLGAYAHQELPFEQVVEALHPTRDLSRSPLFQVFFALQSVPKEVEAQTTEDAEVQMYAWGEAEEAARFDLTLEVRETDQGLRGQLIYSRALFEPETMQRLLGHWQRLLEGAILEPHQSIASLPLSDEQEVKALLEMSGGATRPYPDEHSLPQLIEKQVARTPDAIALVCGENHLSYQELNARANRLAHLLRQHGVGPEVCVGLCLERDPWMLVALLAIHKAGGAYVPLDPSYPDRRLHHMLQDACAPLLLTKTLLLKRFTSFAGKQLCLDAQEERLSTQNETNLESEVIAEKTAYVIYTSGSTGQPKGVQISHRAIINLLLSVGKQPGLRAEDTLLAVTTLSFDIAGLELFLPLITGARLIIANRESTSNGVALAEMIERFGITFMQATPSTWRLLLTSGWQGKPDLKALCGGEPLPLDLARQLLVRLSEVWNMYGPTETTVWSTLSKITSADHRITVGRPLDNTTTYILDTNLQLVPIGVQGLLYIGGDGLAHGYYHQPELTAERFICNPACDVPGRRLYNTGDLARYRHDGTIEVLGRQDQQIKLRGYRIELGEIEEAISLQQGVEACAVLLREDILEQPQLVAYLICREPNAITPGTLREALRQQLPEYMLPTHVIFMEELPLTPNGKIDRQALPVPDLRQQQLEASAVLPQTAVQEVLAGIWQQILGNRPFGIHDDFFSLGGHSLSTTQVYARLRATFNVDLPLRTLFEATTIEQLARQIELARGTSINPGLIQLPLVPHDRPRDLPLSFAQQRLWFLDQLEPESATYNLPMVARLEGDIHIQALELALTKVIERHESLRTRIENRDGRPVMLIRPARGFVLPLIDLSWLSAEEREQEAHRLAQTETTRPFNLAHDALLRVNLLRLDPSTHILLLSMHHIISDGWSMGLLAHELNTLYISMVTGEETAQLPELPIQYADYVLWQREWLQGAALERLYTYWQRQLANMPEMITLPTDFTRPQVQRSAGASRPFTIPGTLLEGLKNVSQREGITLFMTLLAGFQLLLARYSNQEDIVIGTPVANRSQQEVAHLIGFFANSLVLRTDLSGDPTLRDFLSRVRGVCLDAYEHQDMPFEQLLELLQVRRDTSYMPLFQVLFALENMEIEIPEVPGFTSNQWFLDKGTTRFDLAISMRESAQDLSGMIEYSTDLFSSQTISRLLEHFQTLLEQMVLSSAGGHISQLSMLPAYERKKILHTWNETEVPYSHHLCFHQLFEAQVQRTPDAVALVSEGAQLSYCEFNARANQLAHYLQQRNTGPETRIGLYMDRSIELMIALLGILKAGAAYVPLDPGYPVERLNFSITDSEIAILVTDQDPWEGMARQDLPLVHVEREAGEIARQNHHNPDSRVTPDNLAYIIYTSGSIGQPKGVMIAHKGLHNVGEMEGRLFPTGPGSRVLQLASFSFDASLWDVFMALLTGGALYIATGDARLPGPQLTDVLQRQAITIATLTPSVLAALPPDHLPDLRCIVSTGEAVTTKVIKQWGAEHRFFNGYGPTEVTIGASIGECVPEDEIPLIGRPFDNTRIYVLDTYGQPVAISMPGEVFVGGAGLARGYLNRADMTAEHFVPDPFSAEPGARLYRTGDVARWRPNGTLEFLGRVDRQVKLRGFRIELGEIEVVLVQHPAVREAAVIIHETATGEKRLVAYYVGSPQQSAPGSEVLRAHLRQSLPDYMLPMTFIQLEALPLTTNGKVDHRALPAPTFEALKLEERDSTPATPLEQTLVSIWEEVLGMSQISTEANFFSLGGDSILSIQIVARASQKGITLQPRQLFQHQTIAQLAAYLQMQTSKQAIRTATEHVPLGGTVALTPIQHWFFERQLLRPWHYNQAFLFDLLEAVEASALEQVMHALLEVHDALRLRFWLTEEGWQQEYAPPPAPEESIVEIVDLSAIAQQDRQHALEAHAAQVQQSIRLEDGRLMRVVLFNWGDQQPQRLLLVIHHLAVDGLSWRILLEDIQLGYERAARHEAVSLPAKTSSYQQWSTQLSIYAHSEELEQQAHYWRAQLQKAGPPLLNTPETSAEQVHESNHSEKQVSSIHKTLDEAETRALLQEVPPMYHTHINEVLLTALGRVLARWSGRHILQIDMEGHGREGIAEGIDVSRTVGWFTTLYPVVLELEAGEEIGHTLKQVKEQVRSIPQGGIGYGLLRYLRQEQGLQSEGSIVFNYLGQVDQSIRQDRWHQASESEGPLYGADETRAYPWEINAIVSDNRLQIHWSYEIEDHETIAGLIEQFVVELRAIIAHCRQPAAGGYTPSDFPLANLAQSELDRVINGRSGIEDIYPLSSMQEGMLFHTLLAPTSGVYIEQICCQFLGDLDSMKFRDTWQSIIARHTILRTSFAWEGLDAPRQVVQARVEIPWTDHDWRHMPSDEQEHNLANFLQEDRTRGFDPGQAPLMRFNLFQTGKGVCTFVWSSHHSIFDGWSMASVLKEVFTIYEAHQAGTVPALSRPRPYREYIAWLQQQDLTVAESYWREYLHNIEAPTQLGIETTEPAQGGESYASADLALSDETTFALQRLARDYHLTLNTLVQGAWALLLSRYSGDLDVVYGVTVAGRPTSFSDTETMVGLFINTLPVRVRIHPEHMLISWLQEIQEQLVEQRQYEYTPLVQLQGWTNVPRDQSLFESIVVFENYPVDDSVRAGLHEIEIQRIQFVEQTNYPLTVVAQLEKALQLGLTYQKERFTAPTAERLLLHLRTLLEAFVMNPDQKLALLSHVTSEEYTVLTETWSKVDKKYPEETCLHELFEMQAQVTPDAVALVFQSEQLSYAQLNASADLLARYLSQQGVRPDTRVGLHMERSSTMVIALLAILKAGGAYVPFDPTYPTERLEFMVRDAAPLLILTQSSLRDKLGEHSSMQRCLDIETHLWQPSTTDLQAERQPAPTHHSDQLAYVIYTSGSTGWPKGVSMSHRPLSNHFSGQIKQLNLPRSARMLQAASISFDISCNELFTAWLNGGTVVMLPSTQQERQDEIHHLILEQAIQQMITPFALLQQLAEQANQRERWPETLQAVICTAEALQITTSIRRFFDHVSACRLYNEYGPSETHAASAHQLTGPARTWTFLPPIGHPIGNIRLYVLDKQKHLVAIGFAGELYIGGNSMARGYWQHPDLTAERFLPDPFSEIPGARLYRTGDLVRWQEDGTLEYIGRDDTQLKIRGYRIEPGEIEASLLQLAEVQTCAVLAYEAQPGDRRLAAYIVPQDVSHPPAHTTLQKHLLQSLPGYMVPGAFVFIDTLPLTPSGKIDRRALPEPDAGRSELSETYNAPQTLTQELLAGIWQQVLHLDHIGIHDDFFMLGGHSLLATQVFARLQGVFGVELPLRSLFETPTIAALAEQLEAQKRVQEGIDVQELPLVKSATTEVSPLSLSQQRLWILDQLEPGSSLYNMSAAIRLQGDLRGELLRQAIQQVIQRHEILRTSFEERQGVAVQVLSQTLQLELPVIDLSTLSEKEREQAAQQLIKQEAHTPFTLSQAPLLRARIVRVQSLEHLLLLTMHHIVTDGQSIEIIVHEISTFYTAALSMVVGALPPLPLQYSDYARWQRERLRGGALEQQLAYWRKQLAGAPELLRLPTDYARPATISNQGNRKEFTISAEIFQSLKQASLREGVTHFMLTLAAFYLLVSVVSEQQDIIIGTPINNRTRPELEHLVGFFINTLLIRINPTGRGTWHDLLKQVREVCLGAYTHREIPFEQILQTLQPRRTSNYTPYLQLWYTLENGARETVDELPGLVRLPQQEANPLARYDLHLHLSENANGLAGTLEYQTDLFAAPTIERLAHLLIHLLNRLAMAPPDTRIETLSAELKEEDTRLQHRTEDRASEYSARSIKRAARKNMLRTQPQREDLE